MRALTVFISALYLNLWASVSSMVEELPWFKPFRYGMNARYPLWMAKRILKQSLQGLEFLHQNGIAHGDFQPGNMLFTLKDLPRVSHDKLNQDQNYKYGAISPSVERVDGKADKWAPEYLAVPQPLADYADISRNFSVKLSDMGGGQYDYSSHK